MPKPLVFDVFEGYLLLSSLLIFVKELQDNSANRIAHYESEAKKFSVRISPQVILILPNPFLQRNFQMEQVVVLL